MNPNLLATVYPLQNTDRVLMLDSPFIWRRDQSGFSLIELMAVLVIAGVLIAFALPNFRDPLAGTRVAGAVNLFLASIDTARNEAMTKNAVVVVCRSSDPMATDPSCDTTATPVVPSNDWATGWLVYSRGTLASPVASGAPVVTPILNPMTTVQKYDRTTDTLIQRVVPTSGQSDGDRTRLAADTIIGLIGFGPQGTRLEAGGVEPIFAVDYRSDANPLTASIAKCIRVNLIGRPEISSPSGASC
jgi:prepilin-type N-terminal cleavage/methylation domain-containing protein